MSDICRRAYQYLLAPQSSDELRRNQNRPKCPNNERCRNVGKRWPVNHGNGCSKPAEDVDTYIGCGFHRIASYGANSAFKPRPNHCSCWVVGSRRPGLMRRWTPSWWCSKSSRNGSHETAFRSQSIRTRHLLRSPGLNPIPRRLCAHVRNTGTLARVAMSYPYQSFLRPTTPLKRDRRYAPAP